MTRYSIRIGFSDPWSISGESTILEYDAQDLRAETISGQLRSNFVVEESIFDEVEISTRYETESFTRLLGGDVTMVSGTLRNTSSAAQMYFVGGASLAAELTESTT